MNGLRSFFSHTSELHTWVIGLNLVGWAIVIVEAL